MELDRAREKERFELLQATIGVACSHLSIPLFPVFWIADNIYAPQLKWEFLGLRLAVVPFAIIIRHLVTRARSLRAVQLVGSFYVFVNGIVLTAMIAMTEGLGSPYYAGLNLVVIATLTLMPWTAPFALLNIGLIVIPYLALGIVPGAPPWKWQDFVLNCFFLMSTVAMATVVRYMAERLRLSELISRLKLAENLESREQEVRDKVLEISRRRAFESQFSPQVVNAVLQGNVETKEMRERLISYLVVDIENSTAKATQVPSVPYKETIEEVIDVFSSACLKWNVTLEKFTGDGGSAFAGAPIAGPDDFKRALGAVNEMIAMLGSRRSLLEPKWMGPLNVRFSICEGRAQVGFIGRGAFKFYTAISDSVSFTHRLCSVPQPWQVAVYSFVRPVAALPIDASEFEVTRAQVQKLKGFGDKTFDVLLLRPIAQAMEVDLGRCPRCETPLVMIDGDNGLPEAACPGCATRGDGAKSPPPAPSDRAAAA